MTLSTLKKLISTVKWLGTDMKFWAMTAAFIFGSVGYYMLIYISGIEAIPQDFYEAATLDGANKFQQFTRMTLPLMKGVLKTSITFWSILPEKISLEVDRLAPTIQHNITAVKATHNTTII